MENQLINSDIDWIEQQAFDNFSFRIWHVIFMAFSTILAVVILICCCVKIRIPRTKQEIEADYQRKIIAKQFREKLSLIDNQDIDSLDLKAALERVQRGFIIDKKLDNLEVSSQASSMSIGIKTDYMKAEPQQPVYSNNSKFNFGHKIANVMLFNRRGSKGEEIHC